MSKINWLNFQPLQGLSSAHLQTVIAAFSPTGLPPPSFSRLIDLGCGDKLSCEVSVPLNWIRTSKTIVLVHGLGGSHNSSYMIRLSRKFYQKGFKVVRVNLRGCGSGIGLSKKPYNAGNSEDLLKVLDALKLEEPYSEIELIGFSMGGNIVMKLAGELGFSAKKFVKNFFAVCFPLDLAKTVHLIEKNPFRFYHNYFLKKIQKQDCSMLKKNTLSLSEFDNLITAPSWGYQGGEDYYKKCSSQIFLPQIRQSSHLIFAMDDPFISTRDIESLNLPPDVHVYTSKFGGHLGFLGPTPIPRNYYWMDNLLLNWMDEDFNSNIMH